MILRKINAVLSLIITFLFMSHAIFHAAWMLSRGSIAKAQSIMSFVLAGLMLLHAIISIVLAVLGHKGAEKRKCKAYPNMNIPTNIQRISGILLLIFTALHILGASGVTHTPQLVHAIVPPLFFTLSLMHVAVSTSKAFITLGIGNAKFVKVLDIIIKILCAVTLIADVIGFYLYLC